MYYSDYTKLRNHRLRVWKLSDGITLKSINGLDVPALMPATGVGIGTFVLVIFVSRVLSSITGWPLPGVLLGAVVGAATFWATYQAMSSEKMKERPAEALKRRILAQSEPKFYAAGVDSDRTPTHLHWQVLLWRPETTHIRVGSLRRFTTYNPAPIGIDVRQALDSYDTASLVPWADITRDTDMPHREDMD